MKTNFEKVLDFHRAFGLPILEKPDLPVAKRQLLRWHLIEEEVRELHDELMGMADDGHYKPVDLEKVAKESADILYVVYGLAAEFGIDLDKAFSEVHESNMSKLDDDGKPIYRDDGKVMKSDRYWQADMKKVLQNSKILKKGLD